MPPRVAAKKRSNPLSSLPPHSSLSAAGYPPDAYLERLLARQRLLSTRKFGVADEMLR